jgi:hypothetical protein
MATLTAFDGLVLFGPVVIAAGLVLLAHEIFGK